MGSYVDTASVVTASQMAVVGGLMSYTKSPLDGTQLNATLDILTTSGGLNFYPTHLIVTATNAAGAFVSASSISLGAGGSTINLLGATVLTGLNATNLFLVIPLPLVATRVASGQTITAKITTAVVGLSTLTLQLTVAGFYAA